MLNVNGNQILTKKVQRVSIYMIKGARFSYAVKVMSFKTAFGIAVCTIHVCNMSNDKH